MRFIPTIATVIVVVLCVIAGNWQRARMHFKESLQARFEVASAAAPLGTGGVASVASDPAAFRYRRVLLDGTFDAGRQFLLDNRVHAGQAGYDVIAPLVLPDRRTVLIDRGWVPQGRTRATLPAVPAPAGEVKVEGRIELPPVGYIELKSDASPGPVVQHLDLARFTKATGVPVLPFIVQQTRSVGGGDDLVRDWPAPDFGIDTHKIYMVQWYSFALVAAIFWAVTHLRRERRTAMRGGPGA